MMQEKGMDKVYSELIRKYEIQKDTLRTLLSHKDAKESEKDKLSAVIRFIDAFQKDLKDLKDLPF